MQHQKWCTKCLNTKHRIDVIKWRRRHCCVTRAPMMIRISATIGNWNSPRVHDRHDYTQSIKTIVHLSVYTWYDDTCERTCRTCKQLEGGAQKNWNINYYTFTNQPSHTNLIEIYTRYGTSGVGKRVRSKSWYHSRQCGIVIKQRSDGILRFGHWLTLCTLNMHKCAHSSIRDVVGHSGVGKTFSRGPLGRKFYNFLNGALWCYVAGPGLAYPAYQFLSTAHRLYDAWDCSRQLRKQYHSDLSLV